MFTKLNLALFFALAAYCSFCHSQTTIGSPVSFVEKAEIVKANIRTYVLYKNTDTFYLMATRSLNSNRRSVNIYDLTTTKIVASFEDETDSLDSIENATAFVESLGFTQVPPNRGKLTTRASPMSQDGHRAYDLGGIYLVSDKNDECASRFRRSFSIWDSEGKNRLEKFIPMVSTKIENNSLLDCEKFYGHEFESLDYLGLSLASIWPLGNQRYGVSLSAIDNFFIINVTAKDLFSIEKTSDLLLLEYDTYEPLYTKYYSSCFVPAETNAVTLDECISSNLKSDSKFQKLLPQP